MIRYVFYKFYDRENLMRKQFKYNIFITYTFRLCVGWFPLSTAQHSKQESL